MTLNLKKKKIYYLLKAFIIIFLISFLIINWNDISWLFNYRFYSESISNFFEKLGEKLSEKFSFNFAEDFDKDNEIEIISRENSIEIPKIKVSAPLIMAQSSDEADLENDLEKGVVHYPGSVLPGQEGQTIILGHSAPENWPKINYDWIFSDIDKLEIGDRAYLYFDNKEYEYQVEDKFVLEKGKDIPPLLTNNDNMLLLVSCWPPGKDFKRIVVQARLIE